MGTSGTVNNMFLSGLLGGVGNQMMTHEERQYQQKLQELKLKREVLASLASDKTASPQAQALALQGLLSSPDAPKAKGIRGKLGQRTGTSPLDDILSQIKAMPAQTQPAKPPIQMPQIPNAPPQAQAQGRPMSEVPPIQVPGMPGSPPLVPPKLSMMGAPPQIPQQLPGMPEVPGLKVAPGSIMSDPILMREMAMFQLKQSAQGKATDVQLADRGLMRDSEGNIVAAPPERWSPKFKAEQEKLSTVDAMQKAQTELTEARTDYERSKLDPKVPNLDLQLKLARLKQAEARTNYLNRSLNLRERTEERMEASEQFKENEPTGPERAAARTAGGVIRPEIATARQEIAQLGSNELGPFVGRFNAWKNGMGDPPPEYKRLATRLDLIASGISKFHAARGVAAIKLFTNMVDSGKLTPEGLNAGLDAIDDFMADYQKAGTPKHTYKAPGSSQAKAPEMPTKGRWNKAKWAAAHPNEDANAAAAQAKAEGYEVIQ